MKAAPERDAGGETSVRAPAVRPRAEQPALPEPAAAAPAATARGPVDVKALQRLQARAGNAAVARMVAQRAAAGRQPGTTGGGGPTLQRLDAGGGQGLPVAPEGLSPAQDPRFRQVTADVRKKKAALTRHPSAKTAVKAAQDAAVAPGDDKEAQAKAAQVGEMGAAKAAPFDKAGFVAAVNQAIAAQAPRNLQEADGFAASGRADAVKGQVAGQVTAGKQQSAKDIAEKTAAAPDPSKAVEKPVTPLAPPPAAVAPAPPDAKAAAVAPAPAEQTDLSQGPRRTDAQMADAKLTPEQLAHSNEPQFAEALDAKRQADAHAASAPARYRAMESARVAAEQAGAGAVGTAGVRELAGAHAGATQRVAGGQGAAKGQEEQARAAVTAEIKTVFDGTKAETERILGALDGEVETAFDTGQKRAKDAFTADHQARMRRYKDQRYSGLDGAARWLADLVTDLPPEADRIFQESKKLYEQEMQKAVSGIADLIGRRLGEATQRIAKGRAEVEAIVARQPPHLRRFADEAAQRIGGDFDQLDSSVDEKSKAMVDDLAQRYTAARNELDEEIKTLQAENKGLLSKAQDAIGETVRTVMQLKDMLLGVLARAAGAIDRIVARPIEFLGNLVNAVKAGVTGFAARIGDHLKNGLKQWLFGQLSAGGIEIPETFDAKGIVKLVLSVLGLTWNSIRSRVVTAIGEPAMKALESTFEMVRILVTEGVGGLWRWIVEKLSDIKDTVIGAIKDFITEKIVTAGITWIVSMLNPASAFVRACKAIYDVVMFFVNRAAQIKSFVDSVLDSVESIASGGGGGVPALIENTLAKAVPVVLDFLASLLGLGGISEKIKSILAKVQAPVTKVVDWVIGKIVGAGKKLLNTLRRRGRSSGEDAASGTETEQSAQIKERAGRDIGAASSSVKSAPEMMRILGAVQARYGPQGLKSLELRAAGVGGKFSVLAEASPVSSVAEVVTDLTAPTAADLELRLGAFSQETHLFADLPGGPYRTKNDPRGLHAEVKFIGHLDAGLKAAPEGSTTNITVKMNRTPCPACSDALMAAQRHTYPGSRKIKLTVLATSIYGGSQRQSQLREDGNVTLRVSVAKSTLKKLGDLQAAGVTLGVWDIWSHIRAEVLQGMPPVPGLDLPAIEAHVKRSEQLRGWLKGVASEFRPEFVLDKRKVRR
ncbi:phage tail protein [Streptomyces sp.]|uniref:phage tail protein n=1 Tax=Streptomyces sp. TaxID=1931 RepID=UPI002F42572E